jgi:hypothetical protein
MIKALSELSDLELMTLRKRVTHRMALRDSDLYVLVQIATEYVQRGYGASGLCHLDKPTPWGVYADVKSSDDDEE